MRIEFGVYTTHVLLLVVYVFFKITFSVYLTIYMHLQPSSFHYSVNQNQSEEVSN